MPIKWLNGLLQISTIFRGETEPPDLGLGDDNDLYIATPTRNFYVRSAVNGSALGLRGSPDLGGPPFSAAKPTRHPTTA